MSPRSFICLAAIVIWISGCQSSTESTASVLTSESSVEVNDPAETRSKPTSPIGLSYELLGEPRIGQALEIRITSRSSARMSNVTVEVRSDQELMLSAESQRFSIEQVDADEPMDRVVTVTPLSEGSHYLSVTAQAIIDGQIQADYVTISIRVGDVEQQSEPMGTLSTDDSGERVISLPADESP